MTGKEILPRQATGGNKVMLEGKNMSKGMFLYELKNEAGETLFRGKFVVN